MKPLEKRLITCKWCYQIYLIENKSDHYQCVKSRIKRLHRISKSIRYDKTGGQEDDRTSTRN
jgi:hypothetical protein